MEHTNISLSYGIHRTPSIGNDGELSECVNLIPRAGELVNIIPPESVSNITLNNGDKLLFIHQATGSDNYIAWDDQGGLLVYYSDNVTGSVELADDIPSEPIIIAVGNTLIALSEGYTGFFMWKDNEYLYMGSYIPELSIQFGLKLYNRDPSRSEVSWGNTTQIQGAVSDLEQGVSEVYNFFGHPGATDDDEKASRLYDAVFGALNEALAGVEKDNGFTQPFLVRYALRLYDGSTIYPSSPVLMVPSSMPVVKWVNPSGSDDTTKLYFQVEQIFKGVLDYKVNDSSLQALEKWGDIVKSVDIYATRPLYLYDSTREIEKLVSGSGFEDFYHITPYSEGKHEMSSYGLYYRRDDYSLTRSDGTADAGLFKVFFGIPPLTENEIDHVITRENTFYLISSIPLGQLAHTREDVPILRGVVQSLEGQETLIDTYRAHDIRTFSRGISYNARAVLFDATRTPGFGNLRTETLIPYTNEPVNDVLGSLSVYASIKDVNGVIRQVQLGGQADTQYQWPSSNWLFLPDDTIEEVYLQFSQGIVVHQKKVQAIKHSLLNGVYIWLGFGKDLSTWNEQESPASESMPTFPEPNRIFISDALNPFLIRETNAVTLDVGAIRAVSTATQALSQGQFGQFPLYAFTTDGIWALEVSSTGTISARQPVSRDVITEGTLPLQTDNAVVFITPAGLKLLSGSNAVLISGAVEGHNPDDTDYRVAREAYTDINALLTASDTADFVAQLQTASLLYDYAQQLVHIFIPGLAKHYVFALDSHEWSTVVPPASAGGSAFPTAIVPAYPLSLLQYGTTLYRHTGIKSSGIPRPGVALTRPIALGDPTAMKALMDFRIIGQKTSQSTLRRMAVYVSNDGYQWRQLPTLKRGSFKYFRFLLLARLTDYDTLTGITVSHQFRRTNKLR